MTLFSQLTCQTTGRTRAAIVVLTAWVLSAMAMAEPVTFTKDASLRSEPHFDSKPITRVNKGSVGEASTKKGPWLNITTQLGVGWALTTEISYGAASATSSGSVFSTVSGLFGRSPSTKTTSTIGIRGFDEATIAKALDGGALSVAQLASLDSYKVNATAGGSHARDQGLVATNVSY